MAVCLAVSSARTTATLTRAASMAMMAMTTSSSVSVKPRRRASAGRRPWSCCVSFECMGVVVSGWWLVVGEDTPLKSRGSIDDSHFQSRTTIHQPLSPFSSNS